jgi:hypothetical protein
VLDHLVDLRREPADQLAEVIDGGVTCRPRSLEQGVTRGGASPSGGRRPSNTFIVRTPR